MSLHLKDASASASLTQVLQEHRHLRRLDIWRIYYDGFSPLRLLSSPTFGLTSLQLTSERQMTASDVLHILISNQATLQNFSLYHCGPERSPSKLQDAPLLDMPRLRKVLIVACNYFDSHFLRAFSQCNNLHGFRHGSIRSMRGCGLVVRSQKAQIFRECEYKYSTRAMNTVSNASNSFHVDHSLAT